MSGVIDLDKDCNLSISPPKGKRVIVNGVDVVAVIQELGASLEAMRKALEARCLEIEGNLNDVYYAPGMPGFVRAHADFLSPAPLG